MLLTSLSLYQNKIISGTLLRALDFDRNGDIILTSRKAQKVFTHRYNAFLKTQNDILFIFLIVVVENMLSTNLNQKVKSQIRYLFLGEKIKCQNIAEKAKRTRRKLFGSNTVNDICPPPSLVSVGQVRPKGWGAEHCG